MSVPGPVVGWEAQRALKRGASLQLSTFAKHAVEKLQAEWDGALSTMLEIMRDPEAPAGVRSQNAKFIMEHTADLQQKMGGELEDVVRSLQLEGKIDLDALAKKVSDDPDLSRAVLELNRTDDGVASSSISRSRGRTA